MIQLSRLYSRRLSCIYHQISEGRAFDPEKQKTCFTNEAKEP